MLAVTLTTPFLPAKPFHSRQFRLYKRRRLKINSSLPLPSPSPFENLFTTLISQCSSVNSLNFITPALGFASGAALFFSRFNNHRNSSSDVGEWILFSSPTPFNRFVLLRCPSISFKESRDEVNERLVKEEKHYGRIIAKKRERDLELDLDELSYQRVCLSAPDGGVVSLDWPVELDLVEERGLDSTLLLVPGTPQGSMDDNIRVFVIQALKRGFFPIVMNPRGCASSPLTTPRLFTAADSDDICTAITYIIKARPWTTLMAVGWGYGANMLTKYLAEVGERTPLTAATCIDNPFDLDEATRAFPYHHVTDQKLTRGLVDILQTNKALFQGKIKGFNVEKALLAKSVRDFEEAISMRSRRPPKYYSGEAGSGKATTVKFRGKKNRGEKERLTSATSRASAVVAATTTIAESDNGMVPAFSVPRNQIAENPFTSLLLCSCLSSSAMDTNTSALSWCQLVTVEVLKTRLDWADRPANQLEVRLYNQSSQQNLSGHILVCSLLLVNVASWVTSEDTVQPILQVLPFFIWLTAVELGLLKGRHPLLTDIDFTINPSKGLTVVEEVRTEKNPKVGKLLELTRSDAYSGYSIDPSKDLLEKSKDDAGLHFRPQQDLQQNFEQGDVSLQVKNGPAQQTSSTGSDQIGEENAASVDGEHGHVVQTAQVVTNMLDVTMPGTLTEEQKKKGCQGAGSTLLLPVPHLSSFSPRSRPFRDFVLAAVGRGETLMNALEGAVPEDVRGKLKDAVAGILQARGSDLKFDRILSTQSPNLSPEKNNQEKLTGASSAEVREDGSSSNQMKNTSSSIDGSDNIPSGMGEPVEGTETEVIGVEKHSTNLGQSQESNNEVGSIRKETGESRDNNDKNEDLKGKVVPDMDHSEKGLETDSKSYTPNHTDGAGGSEAEAVTEQKSQNSGIAQTDTEENDIPKVDEKSQDFSSDQSKKASTDAKEEPSSPPMSSENQTVEGEVNGSENKDIKNVQQTSPQTNSSNSGSAAPALSVSQAFEALTGMDDSTQMAVNSVFGVIENMLSQLEKSSDNEAEVKDGKAVEHKVEEQQKSNSQNNDSNTSGNPSLDDHHDDMSLRNDSCHAEELKSTRTINGSGVCDSQNCHSNDLPVKKPSNTNSQLIDKRYLVDEWDGHRHVNRMPEFIIAGSYGHGNSLYKKYLRKQLVSDIPTKSLDLDTTTALFLDYFPEGQWKLSQNMEISSADAEIYKEVGSKMKAHTSAKSFDEKECIEPPYVILDTEKQQEPVKELITKDTENRMIHTGDERSEKSIQFVKNRVLDSLKMEVDRKLNVAEMIEMKPKLAEDLEHVANAVSLAVVTSKEQLLYSESQDHDVKGAVGKVGTLDGEHIISAISSSVQQTSCLRKVIPVGVIVGSILAALRKYFNIAPHQESDQGRSRALGDGGKPGGKNYVIVDATEADQVLDEKTSLDHSIKRECVESELEDASKNTVMVDAAIGASAPHQENDQGRSRALGDGGKPGGKNYVIVDATEADQVLDEKTSLDHSIKRECVESELEDASKNTVMV
ncbi:alpha/beta fold hydrolase, partial [Trifolium pratense]